MTVTHKQGNTSTAICHGTAYAGQAGYFTGPTGEADEFAAEWQAQASARIRAASARRLDRANGACTYVLTVERRFASEDAAHTYAACTLPLLLPRGPAHLVLARAGESSVYLPDAVLTRLYSRRSGLSLDIRFEFACGLPTLTNPGA
jgi:hypothetical protein